MIDHARVRQSAPALLPLLLMSVLLAVAGCQMTPPRVDDPLTVMLDREAYPDARQAAAAQAEADLPNDPARVDALETLVTQSGHGQAWQIYALDQLAAADAARTRALLADHLHALSSWDTARHALDLAASHGWADLLPAIVRRYASRSRRFDDATRPERAAIEALAPERTVKQVVLDVFADDGLDIRDRAAAFTLLGRLVDDRDQLLAMLEEAPADDDPLILDLQAAADELHMLPSNLETLTWLRLLRTPLLGDLWSEAAAVIAKLTPAQQQGLAPRHLPVLAHTARDEPQALGRSFADLYAELEAALADAETHSRGSSVDSLADHPQELAAWRDELAFADLLTLRLVLQMMRERAVVDQWFAQADADHADKTTEFGGLMLPHANGRIEPRLYEPSVRRHANAYYAPPQLIFDGYTALAHYHFHAQSHSNGRVAGPGEGDMRRIGDRQQFNAIVLTFIDRDRLNVDYYQAGRVVIDLGTVYR